MDSPRLQSSADDSHRERVLGEGPHATGSVEICQIARVPAYLMEQAGDDPSSLFDPLGVHARDRKLTHIHTRFRVAFDPLSSLV
jgi:hypothetical protein